MALVAQSAPGLVDTKLRGQDELERVASTVLDLLLSLSEFFCGGAVVWGLGNRESSKSLALKGPPASLSFLVKAPVASSRVFDSAVMIPSLSIFVACNCRRCSTAPASGSSRDEDMLGEACGFRMRLAGL